MSHTDVHREITAIWRIESPRLIAGLGRIVRDVGLAEELAQDAFVAALQQWPQSGLPDRPGAWLMATAKNRAVDLVRRDQRFAGKREEVARLIALERDDNIAVDARDAALDDEFGDDMLRLIFTACHPVLSADARVALTLRVLGGLTTDEIARAYLTSEATIAQRIVRAKRTLSDKQVAYEVPRGADLAERLSSVLEVIYLIFNEGYTATVGDDWMRPSLCEDAMRLGRVVAALMPNEPEVFGLVALMELQASRLKARVDSHGAPILLLDQNRAQWDHLLIRRGLEALRQVEALGAAAGPYVLQAAIAACHAEARTADETNWARIAGLYAALAVMTASPVVELNRAVAVSMADGPSAGLALVDALLDEPALAEYHLLPSVRADLLFKLERYDEARGEFERAAAMTRNERERALLLDRARSCEA